MVDPKSPEGTEYLVSVQRVTMGTVNVVASSFCEAQRLAEALAYQGKGQWEQDSDIYNVTLAAVELRYGNLLFPGTRKLYDGEPSLSGSFPSEWTEGVIQSVFVLCEEAIASGESRLDIIELESKEGISNFYRVDIHPSPITKGGGDDPDQVWVDICITYRV